MKILFIQPNPIKNRIGFNSPSTFEKIIGRIERLSISLAFPMLAAVTPRNHSIFFIDENYQNIDYNIECDIVGITAITPEAIRAYEIADSFRNRNIPVVIGGWHASALPKEAKEHADSVVIGEAEDTWPELLNDFENNELKPFYYQKKPVNLNNIPMPRREIIKENFIVTGIQSSRGCPNGCKFCSVTNSLYGNIYRKIPIDKVIKELKSIPQKLIMFFDTSLTIDIVHTKSLFREIIDNDLKKRLICLGNVNILCNDDELLDLAREAGCVQWNVGFESLSQNVLNDMGKKTNKVYNYLKMVRKIHNHGMSVNGLFMFGFDNEPKDVFKNTVDFINESKLDSVFFSILTPIPGTPFYDRMYKEGRILTQDWSKYRYQNNVVFSLKNYSTVELIDNVNKMWENYYSYYNVIKRAFDFTKNKIQNYNPFFYLIKDILKRYYFLRYLNS